MCECKNNPEKKCRCGKAHCWLGALLVCAAAAMLCYVCHSKCGSCHGNNEVTDTIDVVGDSLNNQEGE